MQETRRAGALGLYVALLITAAVIVVADQVTKSLALESLADGPIDVIEGVLTLRLTYNPGGAFGVLQGVPNFFLIATVVIVVFILYWARTVQSAVWAIPLGLVLGGGLGNLFDRVFRDTDGRVVDFVDLHVWPVFNVADSAITLGVLALLIMSFRAERAPDQASERTERPVIRFTPDDTEIGERVDVVLARRADCTRTLAQRALRSGAVLVAGAEVRPSHRLKAGEVVEGEVPDPTLAMPVAEDIPIDVRYSDDRVMVVSKPAGLVTHPAHGHEGSTLVNGLLALGEPLAGASSIRPGIVHRLDKDTSGLLLVAKDDDASEFLVDALRRREVERTYVALVRSPMPAPSGSIDAPIGRHPRRRWAMSVLPSGRAAVTHYRVLDDNGEVALLEVKLETGRTHQIRVHLSHLGHPVLGDGTYGGRSELSARLGLDRPFLHAIRLAWPHPSDGRRVEVRDELPGDLARVLEDAGLDADSIESGS